jgi:hypothetical protein
MYESRSSSFNHSVTAAINPFYDDHKIHQSSRAFPFSLKQRKIGRNSAIRSVDVSTTKIKEGRISVAKMTALFDRGINQNRNACHKLVVAISCAFNPSAGLPL